MRDGCVVGKISVTFVINADPTGVKDIFIRLRAVEKQKYSIVY